MRATIKRRALQAGIAATTSAIMLGAFVGLSAAAPGNGHGNSGESHGQAAASHGNSGESHGHSGDSHGNAGASLVAHNDDDGAQHGNSAEAHDKNDDGTRPGFGCGDQNHIHTGPPGGGPDFDPCTFHVVTRTQTIVSGTETQTITTTETLTGTETSTETVTETATTTSGT